MYKASNEGGEIIMLERLKNPGTIITIVSAALLIASNCGLEVDNEAIMTCVKAACTIGITLGVLNDPSTPGLDLPFYNDRYR
jgi:uncharacterized membrane protein